MVLLTTFFCKTGTFVGMKIAFIFLFFSVDSEETSLIHHALNWAAQEPRGQCFPRSPKKVREREKDPEAVSHTTQRAKV